MQKYLFLILVVVFSCAGVAHAHVVVHPDTVGIGSWETFNVSVPSEREQSTTEIKLLIPEGLESITPTVKRGWDIEILTHTLAEVEHPYAIVWRGGTVPGHFRDDFTFSAKVPSAEAKLVWKAYQKYSDGSIVSWDLDPTGDQPKKDDGSPDFSSVGPFSQTKVVDDLSGALFDPARASLAMSVSALLISLATAVVVLRRKRR